MNKIYSFKKIITKTIILLIFICSSIPFILNGVYTYTQQEEASVKKHTAINRFRWRINMLNGKAKEIDDLIKKSFQSIPISNLSIVITNQKEEIYSMEYGSQTTNNSSFALGSTSKAFTALTILKLLEEYSISLDTPINHYLSEINSKNEITMKDLLNHTSGIGTYETIDKLKFSGKYGAFEYSNTNYNLLGKIIEVMTKDTFENVIETKIFIPLKMKQSFAFSNKTKSQVIQGYKTYFGFPLLYDTKAPNENSWIQAPSGYLCSSAHNMGNFLRYMLKYSYKEKQLLQLVKDEGILVKNSPAIEDIYSSVEGIYSMGWINKTIDNTNILYHTGKLSNFCSFSALIPEQNLGISILCNFGDFLVGTKQMENLFEGTISILVNKHFTNHINTYDYFLKHIIINLLLLTLLILCTLPFFIYYFYGIISKLTIINGSILILLHLIIPYILLNIFSFIGISQQALIDFAPDIYFVFIIASLMLFGTAIWKIITLFLFKNVWN